jgi:ATP-binding cassette subfamily F protein 3
MGAADVPPATRAEQGRRLKQLDDAIEELEMRWLELGELLEQMVRQD